MKTLLEQVNEIKSANSSKASKRAALIKLGITSYECEIILADVTSPVRGSYTFGVEIECGVSRDRLIQAAVNTGFAYQYQSYNHTDGHDFFKFVTDGSLDMTNSIECVSSVLRGNKGKNALQVACRTLKEAGAGVNRSCGLHVHIGAGDLTDEQYVSVFVNYFYLESIIDTFMAQSRRGNNNEYCRTLQNHAALTTNCSCVYDVQMELNYDRYHKVNAQSYGRHRTIEFRQHQGTTDFDKIFAWVSFCGKLVIWSKNNRLSNRIESIADIPFLSDSEKQFFTRRQTELA